jgi:hypothetical protein
MRCTTPMTGPNPERLAQSPRDGHPLFFRKSRKIVRETKAWAARLWAKRL